MTNKVVLFEKRPGGWTLLIGVSACFKSDDGDDFIAFGDVTLPPILGTQEAEVDILGVQVDDPVLSFSTLDRELSSTEEKAAVDALFQEACERTRKAGRE